MDHEVEKRRRTADHSTFELQLNHQRMTQKLESMTHDERGRRQDGFQKPGEATQGTQDEGIDRPVLKQPQNPRDHVSLEEESYKASLAGTYTSRTLQGLGLLKLMGWHWQPGYSGISTAQVSTSDATSWQKIVDRMKLM
jgi:hypothetical protein